MSSRRHKDLFNEPDRLLSDQQRRWLQPPGILKAATYTVLYACNWILMRVLFRLSVEGRDHIPDSSPFIVAPNHASPFDPPLLAASLPLATLRQTYWAGKQTTVLRTRMRRILSWLTRVIPISDGASAVSTGVAILKRQQNLVWFPEGKRSLDGRLQPFKSGIAVLLTTCHVPVVPVYIEGAYQAFPSGAKVPRLRAPVTIRIGEVRTTAQLNGDTPTSEDQRSSVNAIRQCIIQLRDQNRK